MHVRELFDLSGRVALVTGGAGIYGLPISRALAEAGAQVIIASRNPDRHRAAVDHLRAEGLAVVHQPMDQGDEASIRAGRDAVLERFGRLDILVNNAVARPIRRYDEATPERWAESLRVNATGLFLVTQLCLEPMQAQSRGSIINIASIYGVVGNDFGLYAGLGMDSPPDYSFHKGGLINLTRYLATRFAPHGIRVNCVSPGGFQTETMPEEFVRRYSARTPLGRLAREDDIKGVIVFLASDASAYVTGQNICVDGGWTAW